MKNTGRPRFDLDSGGITTRQVVMTRGCSVGVLEN
jgi:hypothetical protein